MTPYRHALVPLNQTPPPGYLPTNLLAPSKDGQQRRIWVSTQIPDTVDHVVAMTGTTRYENTLDALIRQVCAVHCVSRQALLDTSQHRREVVRARSQLILQALDLRKFNGERVYTHATLASALGFRYETVRYAVQAHTARQRDQALRIAAE